MKVNVTMSLQDSVLKWYTWQFSNFDYKAPNKNSGMKYRINTLSYCFKVPTSITLEFLTDENYLLKDAWGCCPLAQYIQAIIHHDIGYNIIDMANQLSFIYCDITLELKVFVLWPTKKCARKFTYSTQVYQSNLQIHLV